MMKKAFSLIELIFAIAVLGIIAAVAIPKLLNTKGSATVSTIKQDISTITTSIQSYYMINGSISNITDSVNLNNNLWQISPLEVDYLDNGTKCISIKVENSTLSISIDQTAGDICKKLYDSGVHSTSYNLQ